MKMMMIAMTRAAMEAEQISAVLIRVIRLLIVIDQVKERLKWPVLIRWKETESMKLALTS